MSSSFYSGGTRVRDPLRRLRQLVLSDAWRVVPARLREARDQRGLTQGRLAEAAGVSRETISRIETGRVAPSFAVLSKIGVALACSPLWLAGLDDFGHVTPAAEVSERVAAFAASEFGEFYRPTENELLVLSAMDVPDDDRGIGDVLATWRVNAGRDPQTGDATETPEFWFARTLQISLLLPDGRVVSSSCGTDHVEALLWNVGASAVLILKHDIETPEEWEEAQPVRQLNMSAEEIGEWARRREAAGEQAGADEGREEGGPEG